MRQNDLRKANTESKKEMSSMCACVFIPNAGILAAVFTSSGSVANGAQFIHADSSAAASSFWQIANNSLSLSQRAKGEAPAESNVCGMSRRYGMSKCYPIWRRKRVTWSRKKQA